MCYKIHSSLNFTKYFIKFHSVFIRTSAKKTPVLILVYFGGIPFFKKCYELTGFGFIL